MGINHGFDRVRFVAPVRSGARIRARFRLAEVRVRPSGYVQIAYDVTMEIEGDARPAFTARWLTIAVLDRGLAGPDRETA
jgi:acyl dehydratase